MSSVVGLLLALIGFGLLIFLHELGHFLVARWCDIDVEVFSIGFGRPIMSRVWKGVRWQVGWFPIGGYVLLRAGNEEQGVQELEHSYAAAAPWRRILVALAGPAANWIVAFVLFVMVFLLGGRILPFGEVSPFIGNINAKSPLAARGLQPGDEVVRLNGHPYRQKREMVEASLSTGGLTLEARSALGVSSPGEPFSINIRRFPLEEANVLLWNPARFMTLRMEGGATPFLEGAPILQSGIQAGDRLIWMDGDFLWAPEQLPSLLSNDTILLTIAREGSMILARVPRKPLAELQISAAARDEWVDWQYGAGLTQRWGDLWGIPAEMSSDLIVQQTEMRPSPDEPPQSSWNIRASHYLKAGDRIVAVCGVPVTSGAEFLKELQTRRVHLMVSRDPLPENPTSGEAQHILEATAQAEWVQALVQQFIQGNRLVAAGSAFMLQPFVPKPLEEFEMSPQRREELNLSFESQIEQAIAMPEPARQQVLTQIQVGRRRNLLGVQDRALQDLQVRYNPWPWTQMSGAIESSLSSIQQLVSGRQQARNLSGPVGVISAMQQSWTTSIASGLHLLGLISLMLAVFNMLPIPILDGGRVLIALWEWVTGKSLPSSMIKWVYLPFMVLLLGLMLYVSFYDILRLLHL